MKSVIFSCIACALFFYNASAQKTTSKGYYYGYDQEMNTYVFQDITGEYFEFATVSDKVIKAFDLKSNKFEGQAFIFTYSTKQVEDEDGNSYDELALLSLERTTLSDEDEDEEELDD